MMTGLPHRSTAKATVPRFAHAGTGIFGAIYNSWMRPNYDVVCVALRPACSLYRRALLLAGAVILLAGCGQPAAATDSEIARTTTPVSEQDVAFAATTTTPDWAKRKTSS